MTEAVLDVSVVVNWFAPSPERGQPEARALRGEYQAGRLAVVVPSLFFVELLNVAGRRWGWDDSALGELAGALEDLLFEVAEPELARVAVWVSRGLTADDAAYLALAEERAVPLATDDETVVRVAGEVAPAAGSSIARRSAGTSRPRRRGPARPGAGRRARRTPG